jgi:hypothetical protein
LFLNLIQLHHILPSGGGDHILSEELVLLCLLEESVVRCLSEEKGLDCFYHEALMLKVVQDDREENYDNFDKAA